jgi:hypothetical protein
MTPVPVAALATRPAPARPQRVPYLLPRRRDKRIEALGAFLDCPAGSNYQPSFTLLIIQTELIG